MDQLYRQSNRSWFSLYNLSSVVVVLRHAAWFLDDKPVMIRIDLIMYDYTLCLKNAPTLALSSFELHGLTLITFGRHNQNNRKNNMHIQL